MTSFVARSMPLAAAALLFITTPAWADSLPPEVYGCQGKAAGAACNSTSFDSNAAPNGTCKMGECTRLDYANWDREAGGPPTKTEPCLTCVATTGTSGTSSSTSSSGAASTTDGGSAPAEAASAEGDDGGCSATGTGARALGPWLLALAVPALVLGARRRKPAK